MSDRIAEAVERGREKLLGPRVVNFNNGMQLVIKINVPQPSITLQKDSKMLLDLRTFAPEGTHIRYNPGGKWGAMLGNETQSPSILIGKFKGVDSALDFLHECGHLHNETLTDLALTAERRYSEQYFGKVPSDHSKERIQALKQRHEAVMYSERNAWAFSLRTVRNLEREFGVNILEQMHGNDGLLSYINNYLREYESQTMTELEYLDLPVVTFDQMRDMLSTLVS